MVNKYFWGVKWLKKVSGKFCVINYMFLIFECKRLKIAKNFTLKRSKIWGLSDYRHG